MRPENGTQPEGNSKQLESKVPVQEIGLGQHGEALHQNGDFFDVHCVGGHCQGDFSSRSRSGSDKGRGEQTSGEIEKAARRKRTAASDGSGKPSEEKTGEKDEKQGGRGRFVYDTQGDKAHSP